MLMRYTLDTASSESYEFANTCEQCGINFIGPKAEQVRALGDKVQAREIAVNADVPLLPGSKSSPKDHSELKRLSKKNRLS